jgi:hypothetical protein
MCLSIPKLIRNLKMKIKEFSCELHTPNKLNIKTANGKEISQGLPPGALRESYVVDEYPACPSNWMNGSDIASSYFVPVAPEKGMWLNFNSNRDHNYDVAVVISIQGINPITGQKTSVLNLEQYKKECPVHNVPFQQDSFCPECGYKWPSQNYLCTTGTPNGSLWLDGFRTSDGETRQYIFTEEEMKGIASQIIGKDRVFAIGIAFYISKEAKPVLPRATGMLRHSFMPPNDSLYGGTQCMDYTVGGNNVLYTSSGGEVNSQDWAEGHADIPIPPKFFSPMHTPRSWDTKGVTSEIVSEPSEEDFRESLKSNDDIMVTASIDSSPVEEVKPVKNLEIGAGALINQEIYSDPKGIDYWEPEPAGMIYINYCDKDTCDNILKSGKREEKKEGFLQNLEITK